MFINRKRQTSGKIKATSEMWGEEIMRSSGVHRDASVNPICLKQYWL